MPSLPARLGRQRRSERSRADLAIASYLAASDQDAAALTRESEQEAATYLATGLPGNGLGANWAQLKADGTADRLRAYRGRLDALAQRRAYAGPLALTRLCPDGTWEPLRLPGDRP